MPLFGKSKEEKEIEREVRYKQGLARVRGYIEKSKETQKRLWTLGKRSLQLGDKRQFQNVARGYLRVGDIISRWERYIVAAETVAVQRGQVKATADFMQTMTALSESMMAGAQPKDVMQMQKQMETALAKAQSLDETLGVVMDATGDTVFSGEGLSEDALKDVEKTMTAEAVSEEGGEADARIKEGLQRIEAQMKKEMGG